MTSKSTFKLTFTALAVSASLSVFAQYNPNIQQNFQPNQNAGFQDAQNYMSGVAAASAASAAATYQNPSAQFLQSSAPANTFGQSGSGYTNDGTLFMGGQRIGNPHQILHDAEVPSLIGITAVRYSFTDVPTYGQGTLAQIQTDMANAPITNDPTRMFSRLYLTTTNPYVQGVATPHNNYQTYEGILTSASAASYQLTAADDGKMYAFKTLSAPNQQSMNILIKELPNTSQFKGSTDLKGGATGVHVTQNGDAAALSAYMSTLKPYDFSWRAALAPYANDPNTGAFVANWVMGSHQVQAYQLGMQNQSAQTGNEAFGVLAWDANQNKYVMLDPTNVQAGANNITGNMPTLGNNQFGFFGMHTHSGSATPSGQDYAMTQQLGLDQMVIGTNGTTAIMTNNPSNNWQGAGFKFEGAWNHHLSTTYAGARRAGDSHDDAERRSFGSANTDFDKGSQGLDAASANKHGMRGQVINPITGQPEDQSLTDFYRAIHDLRQTLDLDHRIHLEQDLLFKEHYGEVWQGPWNIEFFRHFIKDVLISPELREEMTQVAYELTIKNKIDAMLDSVDEAKEATENDVDGIPSTDDGTDYSSNPLGLSTGDDDGNSGSSGGYGGNW